MTTLSLCFAGTSSHALDQALREAADSNSCKDCDRTTYETILSGDKNERRCSIAALRSLSAHLKTTASSVSLFDAARNAKLVLASASVEEKV